MYVREAARCIRTRNLFFKRKPILLDAIFNLEPSILVRHHATRFYEYVFIMTGMC